MVSLCVDCTVNEDLKNLITADAVKGLCGLCGRKTVIVRNPNKFGDVKMLIRALIRYHWDESDYNSHWGGESISYLLSQPSNPVLKPSQIDDHLDEFYELIEDDPYPPEDKGISVYAGFDENGGRMMNTAIHRASSHSLSSMASRLLKENFFQVESDLVDLLSPFIDELTISIPENMTWYRSRSGVRERVIRMVDLDFKYFFMPFCGDDISAPPPPLATAGRLNRQGVSVLYLASDPKTAIAEIRPHPGHYVSVGSFSANRQLKIANFAHSIKGFSANEFRLKSYSLIHAFDVMMSTPVIPEAKKSYLLTQLLAEVLRAKGFDGVQYKSSISEGENICVFHPNKFDYIEGSGIVSKIDNVLYSMSDVAFTIEEHPSDIKTIQS